MRRELGILPSAETQAIYDECVAGLQVAEPELIGRELELARATALLRSEPGAALGALVVRGVAGIGKTAFCRELALVARGEGWIVIAVGATEAAGPYAPIASAIEQLVANDRGLLDAVGGRGRSVLAELTPIAGPAAVLDRPLTRHEVIGAFRRLLLAAGDGAPIALIVDDAHLADEATIDLLMHLGSLGGSSVLAMLSYRPEPSPQALIRGVQRLARGGKAVEIDLGPLDREDAATLVAAAATTPRTARSSIGSSISHRATRSSRSSWRAAPSRVFGRCCRAPATRSPEVSRPRPGHRGDTAAARARGRRPRPRHRRGADRPPRSGHVRAAGPRA